MGGECVCVCEGQRGERCMCVEGGVGRSATHMCMSRLVTHLCTGARIPAVRGPSFILHVNVVPACRAPSKRPDESAQTCAHVHERQFTKHTQKHQ